MRASKAAAQWIITGAIIMMLAIIGMVIGLVVLQLVSTMIVRGPGF